MSWREVLAVCRDLVLRMFPHATRPGLRPIGRPGPQAPVLLTGNYTLTVRRLAAVLAGHDVWLLVANSQGINVWCAAGGGHLTDHDVVAALRVSGVAEREHHRELVLPQLAATGVERRRVTERTGWHCRWGPARLEDLPAFLDRGGHLRKADRRMRFPLWERLEMATIWAFPVTALVGAIVAAATGARSALVAAATVFAVILGLFALVPWLRMWGRKRWLTYVAAALVGTGAGAGALALLGIATPAGLAWLGGACAASMALLSVDFTGTTPWYPSTVNSFGNRFQIELVTDRCTGAAECVQVCPRDVLAMDGPRRKVRIVRPDDCIRCGACIVQCPEDALRFRFEDGAVAEPATVRATRLNMLGRRTVIVPPPSGGAS